MALWKVAVIGGRLKVDYDDYDSYVVRAETEAEARALASTLEYGECPPGVFSDPTTSTCEPLECDGPSGIICASFNAG